MPGRHDAPPKRLAAEHCAQHETVDVISAKLSDASGLASSGALSENFPRRAEMPGTARGVSRYTGSRCSNSLFRRSEEARFHPDAPPHAARPRSVHLAGRAPRARRWHEHLEREPARPPAGGAPPSPSPSLRSPPPAAERRPSRPPRPIPPTHTRGSLKGSSSHNHRSRPAAPHLPRVGERSGAMTTPRRAAARARRASPP